ncbi:MAG: methionyl-tRNA formyltransferase, methionyl-tRNA formyltransferase [candidate division WWE3 bacterium GW2011_GWC1_47_10]|uniref:methionyl-tRNA formyltransferase n=1 Tax=candidate division WWE3 bacterium GW2011_GWC1_47_10 TaxID=1619122 RepID=A0A0G1T8Y3_UNCKA|nr:MAG: methionyl-tRNA formyltransferase, methionyl-tRNA formyltransferase [candidate division WWE3 bacterium GW2011_GWC1_47_10]
MNIAFFGTSNRSVPILDVLREKYNLLLCVTKKSVKVGRHQTLKENAVETWAHEKRVNCLTISRFDVKTTPTVVEQIMNSKITIGVVADFSLIIPQEVIDTPRHKIINIHFSLLPKYRGASPVQHALLNGDEKTGITFYVMDKGMDTGQIVSQVEYALLGNETAGELYETLFDLAAQKLPQVLDGYVAGELQPVAQKGAAAVYTYSKTHPKNTFIYKDDAKIDWRLPPSQIEREIRAYNPWPISWTTLGELCNAVGLRLREGADPQTTVKIYDADLVDKRLAVAQLCVAGKKPMTWKEFVNGYGRG